MTINKGSHVKCGFCMDILPLVVEGAPRIRHCLCGALSIERNWWVFCPRWAFVDEEGNFVDDIGFN